jgi:uncharacterized membrane protein
VAGGRLIGWNVAATVFIAWIWFTVAGMDARGHGETRRDRGRRDRPQRGPGATYTDFAYLAFTIGMTYQVSDTSIASKAIR